MRIALAGQPNCGKSTLFNALAGYRTVTANFPGQTVRYNMSKVRLHGVTLEIVDLPGTYSLTSMDLAEVEARNYILSGSADVVVNVVDASLLSRSLEFTLQLLEMDRPLVVCLNMMDEARRKGIEIDSNTLSRILGVPVVETIASKGVGLEDLVATAIEVGKRGIRGRSPEFHRDIEEAIGEVEAVAGAAAEDMGVPARFLAIKLLEGDEYFLRELGGQPSLIKEVRRVQALLERTHGRPHDVIIASERHAVAMNIFERVARVGEPVRTIQDRVDDFLMHRYWGYIFLISILVGFFYGVFITGRNIEDPIVSAFESLIGWMEGRMGEGLSFYLLKGLAEGLAGGIGIVMPYLIPFLVGMALLEDTGYLSRMAFLMDAFMHRIGLHGKSVLPFVLGYGCSVPAVMATRVLETERDRLVTAFLAVMVPCAARTTVIYGLVAAYIGPIAALFIYLFNILIIALVGRLTTYIIPEVTPGLILEIPPFRLPVLKAVLTKTWFRLREFVLVAWPILIAGSIVLSILEYSGGDVAVNRLLQPLTFLLGVPQAVGTTLIFGILRKELSMIMLFQALGTMDVSSVMSAVQIMVFTVFVVFYIPCVATLAALSRELGWRRTGLICLATVMTGLFAALLVRGLFWLFSPLYR